MPPPRRFVPWLCLLLLCHLQSCIGKYQSGTLRISGPKVENHWKYVSKFGFGIGTGTFSVRLMNLQPGLKDPPKEAVDVARIQLNIYLDEEWDGVETMDDVCGRTAKAKQTREIELGANREWGSWVNGSLAQNVRPHIWYFAISDCYKVLPNFTQKVKFEFHAQQDGGSEFSCEMRWMLTANVFFLLSFSVFCWFFLSGTFKFMKSAGKIHPVIWTLMSGMIVQYLAQVFHVLHLWRYSYNGNGFKPLEILSQILFMLSQVLQTSLLILIAQGYTILQSRMGELDVLIPICFLVAFLHIMLVGFGKIQDDASFKYHENEGVCGYIILVVRLVLYAWFMYAAYTSAQAGGMKLRSFLGQFRLVGSIYFLSYPGIFAITQLFAPYLQHGIMSVGLMCMQLGSNVYLASIFLTRGEYFKVSCLSDSELPGGTKVGVMKEE